MNDKEEYRAKIESQMASFNETIEEITAKAELRKKIRPDFHAKAKALAKKHEDAKDKLKELEKSDENSWQKIQDELDTLVLDVNEDIRSALAYFG